MEFKNQINRSHLEYLEKIVSQPCAHKDEGIDACNGSNCSSCSAWKVLYHCHAAIEKGYGEVLQIDYIKNTSISLPISGKIDEN
jgi:hypothetical protein